MDLFTRYQYTYFIHSYDVGEDKYSKYLLRLLKDKRFSLTIFEKERDLEIYTNFTEYARNLFFPTFELTKKEFSNLSINKKMKILKKNYCTCFEYNLKEDMQGKAGTQDGIFFKVQKIELICFKTGICFLCIKTNVEGSNNFSDVLDFNYKFKESNSKFSELKNFENIRIQSNMFKTMKELPQFIKDITGKNVDYKEFYTYSYTCVDSQDWNEENDFEKIEPQFLKYITTSPNGYNADYNRKKKNIFKTISKFKYTRYGITKNSSCLLVSSMEPFNYTKLPYIYENQYRYTYIINLYLKIYLEKIDLMIKTCTTKALKEFLKFTKEIWEKNITNKETASTYNKELLDVLEVEKTYKRILNKYKLLFNNEKIEKQIRINNILKFFLIISLLLNLILIVKII